VGGGLTAAYLETYGCNYPDDYRGHFLTYNLSINPIPTGLSFTCGIERSFGIDLKYFSNSTKHIIKTYKINKQEVPLLLIKNFPTNIKFIPNYFMFLRAFHQVYAHKTFTQRPKKMLSHYATITKSILTPQEEENLKHNNLNSNEDWLEQPLSEDIISYNSIHEEIINNYQKENKLVAELYNEYYKSLTNCNTLSVQLGGEMSFIPTTGTIGFNVNNYVLIHEISLNDIFNLPQKTTEDFRTAIESLQDLEPEDYIFEVLY